MIINRKVKRTILESKSQYIGSLVLIIFSCLLFTLFNLLSVNLTYISSSFERDYKQEDASFMTDGKLGNLRVLETRYDMSIEETKSVDYELSNDKTLRIFSQNTKVNLPAIIEGKALHGGDILIDPSYAKANQLKIGDPIRIGSREFLVSGYASMPNYIYPLKSLSDIMNDPKSFGIAIMTKNDFTGLHKGSSAYAVRFNGDRSNAEKRIEALQDDLTDRKAMILNWINIADNPRVTYVTAKLKGIDKMSSSMPIAILLLTCILTGIVMWRMLKREAVIIGTLYALGYKKRDIIRHYLMYPVVIALLGGILGTLLGVLTLKPMVGFYVSYFNMPVGTLDINIRYILTSILLPIIFLVVCSYFVVVRALRYSPIELMRGVKEKAKVGFIERKLPLNRFRFKTKFIIREQLRSIPKSIFLLLGIIMASMLLLMGFASKSSMDALMKDSFNEAFKYNYQYIFNSVQHGRPNMGEAFTEIPAALQSDSRHNFTIYGVSPNSRYIAFKDQEGNVLKSDQVIITKPLADKLGIKPHDTLNLINRLDSKEFSITVDGVAETYVGQYIYIPLGRLNRLLEYPIDSYMGLWSTEKLNIPEDRLLTTVTSDEMRKAFDTMTQPLQAVVGGVSFFAFIIGLLVIYVVTSLTIEENKQNISLMKILGYRKREVYGLILNSSSFIVVIGYLLGVPLLQLSLTALFQSVTKDMSVSIPVSIDYVYIVIGFVVIYLTYEFSKLLSRRKVNRISMSEALKSGME